MDGNEIQELKKRYRDIFCKNIKRNGAEKLLKWLETGSDFFTAPASTRFHMCVPGGLAAHSVHVYDRLREDYITNMARTEVRELAESEEETIAVVALLHDVCKANCYKQEPKNQKTYDPEKVGAAQRWQVKHDAGGDFIWETVIGYRFDEDFVMGHGEKSVIIVRSFINLSRDEMLAIRWHMGAWQDGEKQNVGNAFGKCPLAVLLHIADMKATYLDESET